MKKGNTKKGHRTKKQSTSGVGSTCNKKSMKGCGGTKCATSTVNDQSSGGLPLQKKMRKLSKQKENPKAYENCGATCLLGSRVDELEARQEKFFEMVTEILESADPTGLDFADIATLLENLKKEF